MGWRNLRAVLVGMLGGYFAPGLLVWLLGMGALYVNFDALGNSVGFVGVIWMVVFAPLVSGYLCARYAPSHPYQHALIAVAFTMVWLAYREIVQALSGADPLEGYSYSRNPPMLCNASETSRSLCIAMRASGLRWVLFFPVWDRHPSLKGRP